jgi:hypothetical protein
MLESACVLGNIRRLYIPGLSGTGSEPVSGPSGNVQTEIIPGCHILFSRFMLQHVNGIGRHR